MYTYCREGGERGGVGTMGLKGEYIQMKTGLV